MFGPQGHQTPASCVRPHLHNVLATANQRRPHDPDHNRWKKWRIMKQRNNTRWDDAEEYTCTHHAKYTDCIWYHEKHFMFSLFLRFTNYIRPLLFPCLKHFLIFAAPALTSGFCRSFSSFLRAAETMFYLYDTYISHDFTLHFFLHYNFFLNCSVALCKYQRSQWWKCRLHELKFT